MAREQAIERLTVSRPGAVDQDEGGLRICPTLRVKQFRRINGILLHGRAIATILPAMVSNVDLNVMALLWGRGAAPDSEVVPTFVGQTIDLTSRCLASSFHAHKWEMANEHETSVCPGPGDADDDRQHISTAVE
jgi:hypothetical protein